MILELLACLPDDVAETGVLYTEGDADTDADTDGDADADADADTDSDAEAGLVGSWLSTGADLSELFAPYFLSLDATFQANGSYTAHAIDADHATTTFTGSWTTNDSTSPGSIALTQSSPSNAVSHGIYEVRGDTLTYEVVITEPDYGYVAPTPASGFGSTSGPQIEAGVNVQTYRRQ